MIAWTRKMMALGMLATVWLMSSTAAAQMVVSDPTNLVQNTLSVASEAEGVLKQIKQIKNQIDQIKMMKRNLEQLSPQTLGELQASFRELSDLYRQAKHIGMKWDQIDQQFDSLYEDYDPEEEGREGYQRKRKRWEEQTEDAIRAAMIAHGVMEDFGGKEADLDALVEASDSAEGALAAIQAGNRISAVMARQMMELTKIVISDSRAKLSYMKEKQAAEKASRERNQYDMLKGYGEREDSDVDEPENEFPEIK